MTAVITTSLIMVALIRFITFVIGKIFFIAQYGEQIRQLIINMPEYKSNWFSFVDLSRPIKPWHVIRITFFVIRLFGVVFTKHTTVINEVFKSKLPKKTIAFLSFLQVSSWIALLFILIGIVVLLFQQHGYLP